MKILKINIGADGLIAGQITMQIDGFADDIRTQLKEPSKIIVEMTEKGDKPIKGIDYFTAADKKEILDQVQIISDVAPIEIGEIENLF